MKWAEAKTLAEQRIQKVASVIDRAVENEALITLAFYDSDDALRTFEPDNQLDLYAHQMVTGAMRRILLRRTDVRIEKVSLDGYRMWLQQRPDTEQARREYLASLSVLVEG